MYSLMIAGACCLQATAQTDSVASTGSGAHLQKIGKAVYAIIHDDATDEWPNGNTGVVIGDSAVLVVDACYLPSMAREDIRLIRSVTKKPVKYLVITHWHFDHNNGTIAYKQAFPGIAVISQRANQKFIELNGVWWSRMATATGSDKRRSLLVMETALAAGKDSSGKIIPPAELEKMKHTIDQRKNELEELSNLTVVAPNRVFDNQLWLNLGNKRVQLTDRGKANSPHDVTIYVPDEQVLFTGDILVQTPLPYLGASWPANWVPVLQALEKIPVKAIVLGHGPIQYNHDYTKQFRLFLKMASAKVEALIWQGKTLKEIQSSVDYEELRKGVWASPKDLDDWKYNSTVITARLWNCIRGYN